MRAILLNDTRSEEHAGCDLVINNSLSECKRVDIQVVSTVLNSSDDFVQRVEYEAPSFDLVLVNGEGTMHDDRQKALNIAHAAKRAKELGKRVILYNTVWQNNRVLNTYLPYFDLVFCRESLSAREIVEAGCHAEIIPDMIFATHIPEELRKRDGRGIIVLDSVHRKASLRLAWLSLFRGYRYMPISRPGLNRIRKRRVLHKLLCKRVVEPLLPERDLIQTLSRCDTIISPRFHGTCLAFMLLKPVVSIASNTHKIEGLYRDVGLPTNLILKPGQIFRLARLRELDRMKERYLATRTEIQAFVETAERRIAYMFERIRGL
jgi:hypothetical protein